MRFMPLIATITLLAGGCAATNSAQDETVKFIASEKAKKTIDEDGATAAMRGYSKETELVCEQIKKTGSHITTNYCYTRAEGDRARKDHQETFRKISSSRPCAAQEGRAGGKGNCMGDKNIQSPSRRSR